MNKPTAIVTGAGGGIGRAICQTLADDGWFVVANDIHATKCQETEQLINKSGGQGQSIIADIGQEQSVKDLYSQLSSTLGHGANLLVNNAGIQTWSPLTELSAEDWNHTINTNLTGCFLMTKYFSRDIIASRSNLPSDTHGEINASIINIGSGCNTLAFPNLVDYSASKGGIEMLTKTAALELGRHGIRVNCIAPGAISTERTAAETGDYENSWSQLTPLQRTGQPEDVANAVALLCDPRAAFISGQTIGVDGGLFSRAIWPTSYT